MVVARNAQPAGAMTVGRGKGKGRGLREMIDKAADRTIAKRIVRVSDSSVGRRTRVAALTAASR